MSEYKCVTCGEAAVGFFADNKELPLCSLVACEWALLDVLNGEIMEISEEAKELDKGGFDVPCVFFS